ncbi:MAG: glycosyltransferase, partial [Bacteroidales bacterium]|nr:glycosyltransferase [Bacteroidales bacterium]
MKTLLQINVVVNFGSTGNIVEEIGELVISNGWKSYIAFGQSKGKNASKSDTIKIGNVLSIYWHVLMSRLFDCHGLASKKATMKLIKQIEQISPDVIHLHNIHGYYINYKLLFDYLRNTKTHVIWTLHDCWAFTGHCAHFSFIRCMKWKIECNNCPQKSTYPRSILMDRSRSNFLAKKKSFRLDNTRLIIATVSNWLTDLCLQSFLKDIPFKCIHNGVDINVFKPVLEKKKDILEKYNINAGFIILGVASIWAKRKGLDDFVKLSSHLSPDCSIVLVGLSKQQLKNLPPRIVGIQRTENRDELAVIYSSADVFINPTWEDNFPTTNLEALACGTPVITYNTGGSIESITDETGYIVEQGDIEGLLNAIEQIKQ